KDDGVTRLLLEAGARDDPSEPPRDWRAMELPKALLVRPGLLHRGVRRVLSGLKKSFDARPHLALTACPLAIAEMFDKTRTCEKLAAVDVPVPEMFRPQKPIVPGAILGHAHLRKWPTAYVKLN